MLTHTLRVVTPDGVTERKTNPDERLLLKSGGNLESWPMRRIGTVTVNGSGAMLLVVDEHGQWRNLRPADRLEIGDERFPVSELYSFELTRIPEKVEVPEWEQPVFSTTVRIRYRNPNRGEETLVFGSGAQLVGEIVGGPAWQGPQTRGVLLGDVESIEFVREHVNGNGRS